LSLATVTVVVVTRDRRASLLRTLDRLRALPERPPVIVVDNGSADGTAAELRERRPEVRLIRLAANLGSAGRTAGVLAARTPYVAFSDDDSWWEPGALRRAAELLDRAPQLGLLAARITVHPGLREDPICGRMASAAPCPSLPGCHEVLGFIACAAVVRRAAYLAVGGFHPRFGVGGEEDLLALDLTAAGWRCCYAPELLAHHAPDGGHPRAARRRREARNALWTAWLRRRPAGALRRTGQVLRRGWRSPGTWAGLAEAAAGLRWVLAERHPVNAAIEAWRAALDAPPRTAPPAGR
jgi:GT2 family glycosyltransferase